MSDGGEQRKNSGMRKSKIGNILLQKTADISVIIPAYNRANLIGETLRSLLNQTVQAKEIIVVDDGSTDSTAEAAEAEFSVFRKQNSGNLKSKIPTLKIIRQDNSGPGMSRNRGLAVATGEVVHYFDSDDIAAPNKHEVQLRALLELEADIAYGPWVKGFFLPVKKVKEKVTTESAEDQADLRLDRACVYETDSLSIKCADTTVSESTIRAVEGSAYRSSRFRFQDSGFSATGPVLQARGLPEGDLLRALLTNWSVVPHACLFRRSILEKAGGFPEDIWVGEDQLLFFRCLLAGAKVVHTPGTLVFYRLGEKGKLTESKEGQRRRVVDWGRFLLKVKEEAAGRRKGAFAEARGREESNSAKYLTIEQDERAEAQYNQKQVGAWTSQAGADLSNPSASELERDCEKILPNLTAIGSAYPSASISPSAWFGFRLRAYDAWRDLRAFFPGEYLDLESGLEKIWRRSRLSDFRFWFSGFIFRKIAGMMHRVIGSRVKRSFRVGQFTEREAGLFPKEYQSE